MYSRRQKVGNSITSIPKIKVEGIPALFVLKKVSNFLGVYFRLLWALGFLSQRRRKLEAKRTGGFSSFKPLTTLGLRV